MPTTNPKPVAGPKKIDVSKTTETAKIELSHLITELRQRAKRLGTDKEHPDDIARVIKISHAIKNQTGLIIIAAEIRQEQKLTEHGDFKTVKRGFLSRFWRHHLPPVLAKIRLQNNSRTNSHSPNNSTSRQPVDLRIKPTHSPDKASLM